MGSTAIHAAKADMVGKLYGLMNMAKVCGVDDLRQRFATALAGDNLASRPSGWVPEDFVDDTLPRWCRYLEKLD